MAEAFVPLSFAPGEAHKFDWSHEVVLIIRHNCIMITKAVHPVRPLIGRFRPLQDAVWSPVRAHRFMAYKYLIRLILWWITTGKCQGGIDDSPCFPAFTGVASFPMMRAG